MIGLAVSHYRITARLGAGGMGVVYEAEDLRLPRKVALKFLPPGHFDERSRERFQREARTASTLSHPNICTVYDLGEHEGQPFLVLELLEGRTLREQIERQRLPSERVIELAIQISDALEAAHSKGIIHRDIKPANVFLTTRGDAKLLDFGLAKLEPASHPGPTRSEEPTDGLVEPLTEAGVAVGTVGYMSPEQVRGEALDHRTDLFSLAALLYEMATGHQAFAGATTGIVYDAILNREPTNPTARNPSLPPRLGEVIAKGLEKDRRLRYQSAAELKTDLLRLKRDSDSGRVASRPPFRRPRWLRPTAMAGLALVILAGLLALTPSGWRARLLGHGRIKSLVVLPFVNASDQGDATAFSDGIAEGLINALTQVSELRIIARSTAFQYRNEDPLKAGRALDVEAVLTGRVGRQGEQIIVQVDLLAVRDGRQLWGQRLVAPAADVTTIQDRLTREAAEQLRLRLTGSEERRLTKRVTANNEAYLAYLRGRQLWNQRTASSLKEATSAFERAVTLDPQYAEAYTALGETHALLPIYTRTPPRDSVPRAKEMSRRALELDDGLGSAWSLQAFVACRYEYDFETAERAFRRAIALNPGYSTGYDWFGNCLAFTGRFDEAVVMGEQALKYDPLSLIITADHGLRLLVARRLDEAVELLRRLTGVAPGFYRGHYFLGLAYLARKDYPAATTAFAKAVSLESTDLTEAGLAHAHARAGRTLEARNILEKLTAESKTTYVSAWAMATVHAGLAEPDRAFEWLDRAYDERSEGLVRAAVDPLLDPIRGDSRFPALLRRIGLRP